jgi:1-aminocyclopropane-1-carboxylate deaminase/D-cysteine desulfhydrase-like pyridoxal-dependent ACC family enzyme
MMEASSRMKSADVNPAQLRARIQELPRYPLAHRPTPLEPLHRFSKALGEPSIYIKRDDCTGLVFGGNKARHNEFILAEAQRQGADLFVWGGGVQSNNCRQTAAACAKAGIDCHLVLTRGKPGDAPIPLQGNLLLDHLVGASYEFVDVAFGEALERRIAEVAARFQSQGRKVFRWNRYVVTPLAAVSYVECLAEIIEQSHALGFVPDAIYVSSSGSTGAGLTLGARALGYAFPVRNVAYVHWEWDTPADMADIANKTAAMLSLPTRLASGDIDVTFDHIAPGYGQLSPECLEAISLLARTEAVLLDPVYTGKAMAALMDDVRRRKLYPAEARIVFVHTGGAPALFAYGDEFARLPGAARPAVSAGL